MTIDDLPIDRIPAEYERRGLDRLSDDELVAAVTAVVAEPREGPADSFTLHAPLELTARARLLARTGPDPGLRRLARFRIASIAARYQTSPPAVLAGIGPPPAAGSEAGGSDADPVGELVAAVARGDLDGVDRAALASIAASSPDRAVDRLAPAIAQRTAAAAHGPIFLATLTEVPARAPGWWPMIRPLARELGRHPDWGLSWIDRIGAGGDQAGQAADHHDGDALFAALADPPRLGVPGSTFIHPLMMQVDAPGVADRVLGPLVAPDPRDGAGSSGGPGSSRPRRVTPAEARAVTRVAALAMVRDTPDHAPYGWTHCLTMPQAVLTLAPRLERAGVDALAVAATHVLGFRAALAVETLDRADPLIRPAGAAAPARRDRLVTEAARRHDAHIAKYVLAVLTAADADPEAGELYLAAGERLLTVWDELGPDPDDLLADQLSVP